MFCLSHHGAAYVLASKKPVQREHLPYHESAMTCRDGAKLWGKFVITQLAYAVLIVSSLIESVVYMVLSILSVLIVKWNAKPCRFFARLYVSSAFTTFWALTDFLSCRTETLYSIPERILRTCVFQMGVARDGTLERFLINTYGFFTCTPQGINMGRNLLAREALAALGKKDNDDYISLSSRELEEKIVSLGGKWVKKQIDGKSVLAITPPSDVVRTPFATPTRATPTRVAPRTPPSRDQWLELEKAFEKMKWRKVGNEYITCENADAIDENVEHKKLFINVNNPNASYWMLIRKMALYLGCKQNIVFYDPPGGYAAPRDRVASEASYYTHAENVLREAKTGFQDHDIWIGGTCGSCPVVAYLRRKNPEMNVILENGFADLREDHVVPQGGFVTSFADYFKGGLRGRDCQNVDENGFSIEEHWKSQMPGIETDEPDVHHSSRMVSALSARSDGLEEMQRLVGIGIKKTQAKVLITEVSNDDLLGKHGNVISQKMRRLSNNVSENPKTISFQSTRVKNKHSDVASNYDGPRVQMFHYIFSSLN